MSLSSLAPVIVVADDGVVAAPSNPAGRARRRTFTPTQKLKYLSEYEAACETGQGNAYLRGEGLYSSLMTEWRRLKRELAKAQQKLATTEMALDIMGKAHALLEQISESADTGKPHGTR